MHERRTHMLHDTTESFLGAENDKERYISLPRVGSFSFLACGKDAACLLGGKEVQIVPKILSALTGSVLCLSRSFPWDSDFAS